MYTVFMTHSFTCTTDVFPLYIPLNVNNKPTKKCNIKNIEKQDGKTVVCYNFNTRFLKLPSLQQEPCVQLKIPASSKTGIGIARSSGHGLIHSAIRNPAQSEFQEACAGWSLHIPA